LDATLNLGVRYATKTTTLSITEFTQRPEKSSLY